jgi:hypothetical protein
MIVLSQTYTPLEAVSPHALLANGCAEFGFAVQHCSAEIRFLRVTPQPPMEASGTSGREDAAFTHEFDILVRETAAAVCGRVGNNRTSTCRA